MARNTAAHPEIQVVEGDIFDVEEDFPCPRHRVREGDGLEHLGPAVLLDLDRCPHAAG